MKVYSPIYIHTHTQALYTNIQRNIYNNPDWKKAKISNNEWINKQKLVYPFNGLLFSHEILKPVAARHAMLNLMSRFLGDFLLTRLWYFGESHGPETVFPRLFCRWGFHVTQLSPNWLSSTRFEKRREQSPWPHRKQHILLSGRPVGSSQQPVWVLSPLVTCVWSSGWSHQWHLARKAMYCLSNLPGCVAAKACSQFPRRSWKQTNMIFKSAFWLN